MARMRRSDGSGAETRRASSGVVCPECEYRRSRGKEGIHPSRNSMERNVETPSESGRMPGRPTARKAQISSGNRMIQEAKADRPKGRRKAGQPFTCSGITRRIRAQLARPEKGAHVDLVSL